MYGTRAHLLKNAVFARSSSASASARRRCFRRTGVCNGHAHLLRHLSTHSDSQRRTGVSAVPTRGSNRPSSRDHNRQQHALDGASGHVRGTSERAEQALEFFASPESTRDRGHHVLVPRVGYGDAAAWSLLTPAVAASGRQAASSIRYQSANGHRTIPIEHAAERAPNRNRPRVRRSRGKISTLEGAARRALTRRFGAGRTPRRRRSRPGSGCRKT